MPALAIYFLTFKIKNEGQPKPASSLPTKKAVPGDEREKPGEMRSNKVRWLTNGWWCYLCYCCDVWIPVPKN